MEIESLPPSELQQALTKHGSAVDAVLNEHWESWGIGEAMRLLAQMAREIAAAEKRRGGADFMEPGPMSKFFARKVRGDD